MPNGPTIDYRLSELIYYGAVVQLTLLQQFCRYDVYEQRRNLQVCADLCKFSIAVAQLATLQPFSVFRIFIRY